MSHPLPPPNMNILSTMVCQMTLNSLMEQFSRMNLRSSHFCQMVLNEFIVISVLVVHDAPP